MQVRMRLDLDTPDQAKVIGEVPLDRASFDGVIPLLASWGVSDYDGDTYGRENMTGEIQYGRDGAWFEIVLLTEQE